MTANPKHEKKTIDISRLFATAFTSPLKRVTRSTAGAELGRRSRAPRLRRRPAEQLARDLLAGLLGGLEIVAADEGRKRRSNI